MRVLLVDDESMILASYRRLLGRKGHELLTATNLDDALALLEKRPDLALVDLRLTKNESDDRSGLRLVRAIRERGLLCYVAVLTGCVDEPTRRNALLAGANDLLVKVPDGSLHEEVWTFDDVLSSAERYVAEAADRAAAALRALPGPWKERVRIVEQRALARELEDAERNLSAAARNVELDRKTFQRHLHARADDDGSAQATVSTAIDEAAHATSRQGPRGV